MEHRGRIRPATPFSTEVAGMIRRLLSNSPSLVSRSPSTLQVMMRLQESGASRPVAEAAPAPRA